MPSQSNRIPTPYKGTMAWPPPEACISFGFGAPDRDCPLHAGDIFLLLNLPSGNGEGLRSALQPLLRSDTMKCLLYHSSC